MDDGYHVSTIAPVANAFLDVGYRQARRTEQMSDAERLEVARAFVSAKLANYDALFRQRPADGSAKFHAELADLRTRADETGDVMALRGYEGRSARLCFERLGRSIGDPAFELVRRQRERPDRINILLNFGYYLLFTRINATIRMLGVNPFLGFLHEANGRYEGLVCDVQEPFRANVDRLLLRVINQRLVKPEDFAETPKGLKLVGDASRRFVAAFEREMLRLPRSGGMPLGESIHAQCMGVQRFLADGASLVVYRWTRETAGEA